MAKLILDGGQLKLAQAQRRESWTKQYIWDFEQDEVKAPAIDVRKSRTQTHEMPVHKKITTETARMADGVQENLHSIKYWVGIGRTGDQQRGEIRKRNITVVVGAIVCLFAGLAIATSQTAPVQPSAIVASASTESTFKPASEESAQATDEVEETEEEQVSESKEKPVFTDEDSESTAPETKVVSRSVSQPVAANYQAPFVLPAAPVATDNNESEESTDKEEANKQ